METFIWFCMSFHVRKLVGITANGKFLFLRFSKNSITAFYPGKWLRGIYVGKRNKQVFSLLSSPSLMYFEHVYQAFVLHYALQYTYIMGVYINSSLFFGTFVWNIWQYLVWA